MYESFYKLNPTPFRLTPDPHFFFESETHKRGLAYLRFAFYQREGFVAITGAPGTGKTELTLNLIEELPHNKVTLAKIVTTNLDADDLLDLVAESFEIDIKNVSKGTELKKLEDFFIRQARTGKQVLLIIDEAHNLSVKSLLELSMLENFQLNEKPLMQCFLLGQLPLEEKLNLPELEPLKQRVIASARLESLNQQETRDYIIHRLSKSGWKNNPVIRDEAFYFIYQYTHGVPRKINSLCNRLLLNSYVEQRHEIDTNTVRQVIQEISGETVKESLDLDFATIEPSKDSHSDIETEQSTQPLIAEKSDAEQPVQTSEASTPQAAKPRNRMSRNSKSSHKLDDTIDIPEFLRKTEDEDQHSQLKTLKEIKEPETHELPRGDTRPETKPHYQAAQNSHLSQRESSVAMAQLATPLPAHRPSGLLDKELQFLASLVESAAPAATPVTPAISIPEEKLEPRPASKPAVEKKLQQKKVTVPKIIIDDSACDVAVDIDELIDNNYENSRLHPETSSPGIDDWRLTAVAVVVVTGLIISIGWLYNSDSVPADTVAENKSPPNSASQNPFESEVVTTAAAVDIELPVISSADSNTQTVNEINSETGSEIADAGTPVVTDIKTTVAKDETTARVRDSVNTPDNSKPVELETQLTQLLERAEPDNVEHTNTDNNDSPVTTENVAYKKDARENGTADSDTHKSNAQSETAVLLTDNQGASLKPDTTPGIASTTPGVKATQPETVSVQEIKPDLALVEPSIEPAPSSRADPVSAGISSAISATTQAPDTEDVSISLFNSEANSITRRPEPAISNDDLTTLLSRLSAAYETGNLQQLVSTFAPDIKSSDGSSRRQMLKEYQRLFNITDKRQLTIQDVEWSTKDRLALGKGDFTVSIREKGATKYTTYQGKISFAVARESNSIVIKKLDYDYGQ